RSAREPRSQRELARQLERDEATLSHWKRLPGFHDAVYALTHDQLVAELAPILWAQVREAKKGSLAHAQWLFGLAGVWAPKSAPELAASGQVRIVVEVVDDRHP